MSLSDGKHYFGNMAAYPYEYEETRKEHPPETNPGYYRFAVDSYYDSDTGETVSISTKWTDWYYLSNSIYYSNGVRSGD